MTPLWPLPAIGFEPVLANWFLIVAAVIGLVVLGIYIWRSGRAPLSRALSLGVLLLALAGPSRVTEDKIKLPDVVAILVDTSESMRLAGRDAGAQAALNALKAKLAREAGLDVRVVNVADTRTGTDISPALDQALSDVPPQRVAAAIVLTDGLLTQVEDSVRPYPIHQALMGSQNERDRRIVIRSVPRSAPIGENARVVVRIEDAAPNVPLTLYLDQEPPQTQSVPTGEDIVIEVPVTRRGAIPIGLETPLVRGEMSGSNNAVALSVLGVRDRLRVMLVTGEPYAGGRAWRNLLKSDPSVDLVQFTILRAPDKQDYTPVDELSLIQFPTRELFVDKISSFDLVVFDRFTRLAVLPDPYLESVAQWVEDGGALLTLAGPAESANAGVFSTPLARVIPVTPQGKTIAQPFRPTLTARGLNHPVAAGLAPLAQDWGQWLRVQASTPRGDVLLEGAGQPLLVLSQVNKGRVAAIMSDQAWLWRRGYDGGGPFDELFRRTAHWLMKEADLEADKLTLRSVPGKLLIEQVSTTDPGPATVSSRGTSVDLPLTRDGATNVWRGEMAVAQPQLFHVKLLNKQAFIVAGLGNPNENRSLRADGAALAQPQSKGGGGGTQFWLGRDGKGPIPDISRIGANQSARTSNLALRQTNSQSITATRTQPLLPPWAYALAIVALSFLGWYREGR